MDRLETFSESEFLAKLFALFPKMSDTDKFGLYCFANGIVVGQEKRKD